MTKLQDIVVKEMKVKAHIGSEHEVHEIIHFIKEYVQSHAFIKSLVLGISGGQDSTLCGKLCQMAVDELKEEIEQFFENLESRYDEGGLDD